MDLKVIILREVRKRQIPYDIICGLKYNTNRNILTDIGNRLVVTKRDGGCRREGLGVRD